jgi:hypothetical protein
VTFTATITTGTATSIPTGLVTFYNGAQVAANIMGSATLNSAGVASLTTPLATIGSASVSAVYAGDENYHGSASQAFTETVNAATFTISATPATQTISGSGTATITVTVTPQGPYTSTITFTAVVSPSSSAQVSFSPAQVTPNSGAATTTLTIQGATAAQAARTASSPVLSMLETCFLWAPSGLAGLLLIGRRKKTTRRTLPIFLFAAIALTMGLTMLGCGGVSQSSSAKPQTYQVKITAAGSASGNSGAVTVATTVAFTAQ